jgi:gliding motility-associated-like protein
LNADSGFATYKWQDGSPDSFYLAYKPGQYYVSVTDFCGQQYSDTINITKAVYYFSIGNDTSICVGDTVTLTATQGFTSYRWRPAGSISADTGYTIKAYPVVSTAYTASAEKQPGCLVYDTVNVTVLSAPPINLGNDTSICAGAQVTLNAGPGFATYKWSNGAVTPQITVTQPGTYLVKATAINGCSALDSFTLLQVYPLPLFTLGNRDTAICQGENITYQFNLPGAAYAWSDGNTNGTQVITQPGTYWLRVTQNGCSSADTVILAVKPSPVVSLGNDTTLCAGTVKVLSAPNPGATYVWQDGSTGQTYTVVHAGLYFVTADINGCTAGDTINIAYLNPPVFNLGRDTFLCTGTTILLNPTLNAPVSYVWQDGSTAASYMVQTPGTFYLTASNQCGSVTDSINITIGVCKLLMPSAFTPNGDGINDVFKVKYPFPVKKFNFVVFNRWGQKMFETNDIGQGWDGTFNGFAQPLGTYIWEISLIDGQGVAQTAKGTITIIR